MQGQSYATPTKEYHIKSVVKMRLRQRKNQDWIEKINVYDIFSGDGQNIVDGIDMQGSPLEIADAISESGVDAQFVASDIRAFSVKILEAKLNAKKQIDLLRNLDFSVNQNSAENQLDVIHDFLDEDRRNHAIVVIDPNGPKVMPFEKMRYIMATHGNQCDMIINVAETHLARIMACNITKNKNWWARFDSVVDALWAIVATTGNGWLRKPLRIEGNPCGVNSHRWRFVCVWGFAPPRNEWRTENFFRVDSLQSLKKQMERAKP